MTISSGPATLLKHIGNSDIGCVWERALTLTTCVRSTAAEPALMLQQPSNHATARPHQPPLLSCRPEAPAQLLQAGVLPAAPRRPAHLGFKVLRSGHKTCGAPSAGWGAPSGAQAPSAPRVQGFAIRAQDPWRTFCRLGCSQRRPGAQRT